MIAQVDLRYLYADTLQEMAMFPNPFNCNICKCNETKLLYTFDEEASYNIPAGSVDIVPHLADDGETVLPGQWIRVNADADIGYTGVISVESANWSGPASGYYVYTVTFPTIITDHICQLYRKVGSNYEVMFVESQTQNNNTLTLKVPTIPDGRFTGKYVLLPINYASTISHSV